MELKNATVLVTLLLLVVQAFAPTSGKPTTVSSFSADIPSSTEAASNVTTSNTSAATRPYVVRTQFGATPQQLETIIDDYNLPRDGRRRDLTGGWNYQSYYCELSEEQARQLQDDARVRYCDLNLRVEDYPSRAHPRALVEESRDPNLWKRAPEDTWTQLNLFSADKDNELSQQFEGILFDKNLGEGSIIYVIDGGYNKDHSEFTTRPGRHRSYVVPNALTEADAPQDERDYADWSEDEGYIGHGTATASLAGGATVSFAPAAELVVVKIKNGKSVADKQGFYPMDYTTEEALEDAFAFILRDVKRTSKNRKAIVTYQSGLEWISNLERVQGEYKGPLQEIFENFIKTCKKEGIIFVTAAGNSGGKWVEGVPGPKKDTLRWVPAEGPKQIGAVASLDFTYPQRLGTNTNNVITVGGCEPDGYLWAKSTPFIKSNGGWGSITTYAQALDVQAASNRNNDKKEERSGTSMSAPLVAGLIAYLLSVDTIYSQFSDNNEQFVLDVKNFVKNNAWSRCPRWDCLFGDNLLVNYGADVPEEIPVPINMAWKGYNAVRPGTPPKRSLFPESDPLLLRKSTSGDVSTTWPEDTQVVLNFLPVINQDDFINGYYLCPTNITDCPGPELSTLHSNSSAAPSSSSESNPGPSSFSTSVTPDTSTVDPETSTLTTSTSSTPSTTSSTSASTTSTSSSASSSTSSATVATPTTSDGDDCPYGIEAEEGTVNSCLPFTRLA